MSTAEVDPDGPHTRRWPVSLAVVAVLVLQLATPAELSLGPPWVAPLVLAVLLAPLVVANPTRLERDHPLLRALSLVVAVLFWELDRGGPFARDPHHARDEDDWDLLFPQLTLPGYAAWRPSFLDYLFVAFTASTAFSPTDTMPLTRSFKVLFMLASATAFTTIAVVAARAVNLA